MSGMGLSLVFLSVKLHFWRNIFTKINKHFQCYFSMIRLLGHSFTGELGGQRKEN